MIDSWNPTTDELALQSRKRGVRDPGDAWVRAADGNSYWGKFGAAGLLAHDRDRGVLMQHRVEWSDHGGTWGIPGGAINQGETPIPAAIREANEEAGVPHEALKPLFTLVVDRGGWKYTTVVADSVPFEARITDPESLALEWVPIEQVAQRPLHPGFAKSWPMLQRLLELTADEDAMRLLETLRSEGYDVAALS